MPTEPKSSKKSASARANGAKSHGPATAAGRARSSQNALRHGLATGPAFTRGAIRRRAALPPMSIILGEESPADFQRLLDSYLDEFAPTSPIEVELVETMASARWRLRRLANIETILLGNEIDTSVEDVARELEGVDREPDVDDHLAYAFKRLAEGASLHLLNRYEGTINRSYAQAFKQLHLLRSLRIRVQPNEPKQSVASLPAEPEGDRAPEFTEFTEFTRGADRRPGGADRRPGPIRPNKIDDKALPAPPPISQTPPQSPKIHVEPRQIPAPPVPTCDNGDSPRINDQHLHS